MSALSPAAEYAEHFGGHGGLRAELRAATTALHARIDVAMPLARRAPDLADYLEHLLLLRDWLSALRCALPGLPGMGGEYEAVIADAELAATLTGQAVPPFNPTPAPEAAALRALDAGPHAAAARLGVRYVIEGSHLGGKVLRRRWSERLAPHPLNYLNAGGGSRWAAFLTELAGRAWTAGERAAACRGAVLAFELLQRGAAEPAAAERAS
ncbi:biliverdin-producing heme oxygenase [Ottowia testudinis]|uniref:Biliverdin-producing heme oxygenase n=1 Tax=Ottowia testudinis TaxID=2816950 RepID=A0A975CHT7_9BURK|nr:biliverdin-producing heme oxygenase [Ottowia testudinis]QTD45849.1 biliverdin-producing heme oxygenase [Ottowia testudinis]